jgi:hypothetical protein
MLSYFVTLNTILSKVVFMKAEDRRQRVLMQPLPVDEKGLK